MQYLIYILYIIFYNIYIWGVIVSTSSNASTITQLLVPKSDNNNINNNNNIRIYVNCGYTLIHKYAHTHLHPLPYIPITNETRPPTALCK